MPAGSALIRPAREWLALAALFAGATAIATAPLFVKVSETGPVATAFWRVALALPALWAWALLDTGAQHWRHGKNHSGMLAAIGVFFAGDLAVWHWSIVLTSVANATLLANLAPIFVAAAAWIFFSARPRPLFLTGLVTSTGGTALLIGGDFGHGGTALIGDALGVVTALFYAAYQMAVTRLRAQVSTASLMAWSSTVMAIILLPIAVLSGEALLPHSATGWLWLIGLALIAQVAGQSLIAYAMAHLPGVFSSVGLLLQPVMAALFAWVLLAEALGLAQMAGGLLVLGGIVLARQATAQPRPI